MKANISYTQVWDDFYFKTNGIARALDPTRQTGGVRNIEHSEFLEDVYTFNDFSHRGNNKGLDDKSNVTKKVPYLVTEFNGHMFPTKRYDNEVHRVDHALRHLNVINEMLTPDNNISGCIGWVMNDYNTHQEFGSGDRVCYHGVMDMFRTPKYAAGVYRSQSDHSPFIQILGNLNVGEQEASEIKELMDYGITRIYSPDDGRELGLQGMINDKNVIIPIKK